MHQTLEEEKEKKVESSQIDLIISELPADIIEHSVRDVSLLFSSVFAKIHFTRLREMFGARFSAIFMHCGENQTSIYRSPSENNQFARQAAELCSDKPGFAEEMVRESIELTDWINDFIQSHQTIEKFKANSNLFFSKLELFLTYHQAIYFGGEYLAEHFKEKQKSTEDILGSLVRAYSYQEMVPPDLEKYFAKLGISDSIPDEVVENRLLSGKVKRSVLRLNGRELILSDEEATLLAGSIDKKTKTTIISDKIEGLGVGKGSYKGKVQLIKNLNLLGEVRRGVVLVSHTTRPQYNQQIKHAGAIVTDTGGILSHPAIIAREFGIPCVVGTKIATKVLKDDDIVEVDAETGIIRKK